ALKEIGARIEKLDADVAPSASDAATPPEVPAPAEGPAGANVGEPSASEPQDHEVPTAKEVANNAANAQAAVERSQKVSGGKKGAKAAKATKELKAPKPAKPKRVSALDAAAQVIATADKPMRAVD